MPSVTILDTSTTSARELERIELHQTQHRTRHGKPDDDRCLTQGDSGTPAFYVGNADRPELAAVLVSGTKECPALQILANVSHFSSWVDATIQWRQLHPE